MRKEQEKDEDNKKSGVEFNNLPIDELLLLILNNYQKNDSSKDLIDLFHNNEYANRIVEIICLHIDSFKTKDNKLNPEIITSLDELINENKRDASK